MIPTLIGVTVVVFLIMRLAPGDPLQMQLSQTGAQGESSTTREAYLLQRRQWKLDKPWFLNLRYFKDYSKLAEHCAYYRGRSAEQILDDLNRFAGGETNERLEFLRTLGIESFETRLRDPALRERLVKAVEIGVQIQVETLAEHGVRFFVDILRNSRDLSMRIGAIRCLVISTFGDPFVYTYSKDPLPEETEPIVSTWKLWWRREQDKFPPPPPERLAAVDRKFRELVAEPSRGKILEGMNAFAKTDAPYFMEKLTGDTTLKEKYVASLALKSWIGKPLKVDVKLTDPEDKVKPVAENWIAYYEAHPKKFNPPLLSKIWYAISDTQYANTVAKLATFSFGKSMVSPYDPVGPKIWQAALVSAPLMLLSQLLVYLIAVPTGIVCAVTRGRWPDRAISLGLFLLYSIPAYVAGMLFLTFLCYGKPLAIFPKVGLHSDGYESFSFLRMAADYLWHIALPVTCMSVFGLAGLAMYSRTSMLDVVNQDYIRTARAKGLPERAVILRHGLRNALIPIITLFANFLPALLGGSVIIESLFSIPGMGYLSFHSIQAKDYNTMSALIYIDAIVVMVSILLTDILYVIVDPRISFARAGAGA